MNAHTHAHTQTHAHTRTRTHTNTYANTVAGFYDFERVDPPWQVKEFKIKGPHQFNV